MSDHPNTIVFSFPLYEGVEEPDDLLPKDVAEFVLNKELGRDPTITYTHYDNIFANLSNTESIKRLAISFLCGKRYCGFIFENLKSTKLGGSYSETGYTGFYALHTSQLCVSRGISCYFNDPSYSNDIYINYNYTTGVGEIVFFNGAWKITYNSSTGKYFLCVPRSSEGLVPSHFKPYNDTYGGSPAFKSEPITNICLTKGN